MLAEEEQCVEEEQVSEAAEANSERAENLNHLKKVADQTSTLYLFGRTGREKEEWYQHFLLASKTKIYGEEPKSGTELNQTWSCCKQKKAWYIVKWVTNICNKFKFNAEKS